MNCVALIRGINVGTTKRISMTELRELFVQLGYAHVRTLLNSGNVIFATRRASPQKLRSRIEDAIEAKFGHRTAVAIIPAAELRVIIEENPLLDVAKDFSRHFVAFAADGAALRALDPLLEQSWKPDVLAITPRAAYLWCKAGAIDSKLSQVFGRKAGSTVTLRNWATVLKIQALVAGGQE